MNTNTINRQPLPPIPKELHRLFKACVSLEGKSMTDVLIEIIHEYIEQKEKEL